MEAESIESLIDGFVGELEKGLEAAISSGISAFPEAVAIEDLDVDAGDLNPTPNPLCAIREKLEALPEHVRTAMLGVLTTRMRTGLVLSNSRGIATALLSSLLNPELAERLAAGFLQLLKGQGVPGS